MWSKIIEALTWVLGWTMFFAFIYLLLITEY